jgi:putative tryptophan/tyrosine transport system substrate-binding protein
MQRRDFITLLGGAATLPLAAHAQQVTTPVVGFLHSGSKLRSPHVIGFGKGLNETGFVDGRNVTVQYRFAEGHYDRLPAMVADFVNGNVAVLAAVGGVQTALAAKPASATIPVIFANGSDPVHFGLVESLNRPGANMTGVSFFTATLEAKRLGLLFELVPAARTFGILINPTNDNAELQLKDIAQGGLTLSRPITIQKASNEREIEAAFETFT